MNSQSMFTTTDTVRTHRRDLARLASPRSEGLRLRRTDKSNRHSAR